MITLRNLTLRRGERLLLEDAGASFVPGARIGVVGPNGCGKSSLFAALAGELHPDRGAIDMPPRLTMSRVRQEIDATAQAVIEYVLDGDPAFRAAEAEIAAAQAENQGERLGLAHGQFEAIDGWSVRARAAAILDGLGFGSADHARPVGEFSGGWRMRANLARALMCRADLLLLDEPTNHLDLDAVMWLERWLAGFRGTLFLISHDRELLDGTTTEILHFDNAKLRQYTGNYADFERARAMALSQQAAAYAGQQRRITKLQSFIDRFRAKATKAKQAQSRLKALERMERIAPAHVDSPFSFSFRDPPGSPDPLLLLEACRAGYADTTVIDGVTLSIAKGARYGLLGRNGAGKSTLIRLIAGHLAPLDGRADARREGKGLRIGYFAQHQLEALDLAATPLLHLQRLHARAREQELRDYLGGFAFHGDVALEPVARLSGGEKARLALALLIWQKPNLLLLDEPTNHLDIDTREALTEALQEYSGALVLVSHDRYLLRTTCDAFLLVADGRVVPYEGDLDDYRQGLAAPPSGADEEQSPKTASRRDERREAAQAREIENRRRRPLEKRIAQIEAELARITAEQAQLDTRLASPAFYGEGASDAVRQTLIARARLATHIEKLETDWLDLHARLEAQELQPSQEPVAK